MSTPRRHWTRTMVLDALKRGGRHFDELYRDLVSAVFGALPRVGRWCSCLRGPLHRTDVASEIVLRLMNNDWAGLKSYDDERGALTTFIGAVTFNFLRSRCTTCRRRSEPGVPTPPVAGADELMHQNEVWRQLRAATTPRDYEVFYHYRVDGVDEYALAKAYGTSPGNIKVIVSRVGARLRDLLK